MVERFPTLLAEDLQLYAGLTPGEAHGALRVARGLWGPRCLVRLPRRALGGRATVRMPAGGVCRVYVHSEAGAGRLNYLVARELGLWLLERQGFRANDPTILANRIAVELVAPERPFRRLLDWYGSIGAVADHLRIPFPLAVARAEELGLAARWLARPTAV